jgi:hypothetical protein
VYIYIMTKDDSKRVIHLGGDDSSVDESEHETEPESDTSSTTSSDSSSPFTERTTSVSESDNESDSVSDSSEDGEGSEYASTVENLEGGSDGSGSDSDETKSTSSISTTEVLAGDPLYLVLNNVFVTKNGSKNIADILQEINLKLDKLLHKSKK